MDGKVPASRLSDRFYIDAEKNRRLPTAGGGKNWRKDSAPESAPISKKAMERYFLRAPKSSVLAQVIFKDLLGDGTLSKPGLKVIPQIPEQAANADSNFSYSPDDARFDQVQSFYFVDRALSFFQNRLGVTLPFSLVVETQFGAPEKLNAMFYYHGQIRLGLGDGHQLCQFDEKILAL